MNISFTKTKLYDDINEYWYTKTDFICPCCLVKICFFTSEKYKHEYIYTTHFYTSQNQCCIESTLDHTDVNWKISNVEEYENKLNVFFNSTEYFNLVKTTIIKEL